LTGSNIYIRVWWSVDRFLPTPFPGGSLYADAGPFAVIDGATAQNGGFITTQFTGSPVWQQAGSGGAPAVTVKMAGNVIASGATLPFGHSVIGTPVQNTLWVINTGTADLTVGNFATTGDYGTTSATTPIHAGDSASFAIHFTPTATGARPGTFSFTSNAAGSPYTLVLSGTGDPVPAPALAVTIGGNPVPNPVDYGSLVLGSHGDVVFHLANTGNAPLHVSALAGSGDYAVQGLTSYTINASSSQDVTVRFAPSTTGTRNGNFTFAHDAAGGSYSAALTGVGSPVPVPNVAVTIAGNSVPDPVDFGSVTLPNTSTITFHIQNTGTANLSVSALAATGDYAVQGATSYPNITPLTGVNVTVVFTPSTTGTITGTFSFTHNAAGSPYSANLTGVGVPAAVPGLTVDDGVNTYVSGGTLNFASTPVGHTSNVLLTITNSGTAPLTLSGFSATGAFQTTTPASPVAPGGNVSVTVSFSPLSIGPASGTFSFSHNAAGANPFSLTLSGTANPYHNNVNNPNGPGTGYHATFPNDPGTNGLPPLVLDFGTPGTNPSNLDCIVQDTRYITMPGNIPGFGGDQPWDNNLTIHRYWDITATGGVGWTCTVYFYFTSNDLPAGIVDPTAVPLYAYAYNTISHTWSYYVVHVTLFQAGSPNVYQGVVFDIGGFSEWEITQQQPTPVNALRFNAAAGDRSVALNWHVEAEVSNAYYRIERRNVTENTDWTVIHNVNSLAPNGTSSQPLNYRYADNYNLINGETYEYRIADVSMDGIATNRATIQATPHAAVIADYSLANFPNPFNPETRISYTMKAEGKVKISVTDVMGRTIATLVNGETRAAGTYNITWKANNMPSGIYFLNMEANGFTAMRKMVLAK